MAQWLIILMPPLPYAMRDLLRGRLHNGSGFAIQCQPPLFRSRHSSSSVRPRQPSAITAPASPSPLFIISHATLINTIASLLLHTGRFHVRHCPTPLQPILFAGLLAILRIRRVIAFHQASSLATILRFHTPSRRQIVMSRSRDILPFAWLVLHFLRLLSRFSGCRFSGWFQVRRAAFTRRCRHCLQ